MDLKEGDVIIQDASWLSTMYKNRKGVVKFFKSQNEPWANTDYWGQEFDTGVSVPIEFNKPYIIESILCQEK